MKQTKWNAFLELGRVSNLPTCISNSTAGFYIAGGNIIETPFLWLIAVISTICFYEAGMILNDLFDYPIDKLERPNRPLPSGRIKTEEAIGVFFGLLGIGLFLVKMFIPNAIPVACSLIGLIFLYNWIHQKFILSPFIMGICRGSVYLLAASAAGWKLNFEQPTIWMLSGALILYITSVSFIARDELNQDLSLNQKISLLLASSALFIPLCTSTISLLLTFTFIVAMGWMSWISARLIHQRIPTMGAVGKMLAGMSLLDALILAEAQSTVGVFVAWSCFLGTLNWHKRIQGT